MAVTSTQSVHGAAHQHTPASPGSREAAAPAWACRRTSAPLLALLCFKHLWGAAAITRGDAEEDSHEFSLAVALCQTSGLSFCFSF